MGNLDLKFYWAVFLRRLPYFLVVTALLTAVAVTLAFVLPPKYRSQASMLVEPQQIPGELAESMVPINPFEQIQIIEQRLMTRANLLEMAQKIGLDAAQPGLTAGEIVRDTRQSIEFLGFEPDVTKMRGVPGATIIGVAFEAPTPQLAYRGASELVNLILAENVKLRTGRAGDTLEFFQTEVEQLEADLARRSQELADFKTANVRALPESMAMVRAQQEREQAAADRARARGGVAEEPARHRRLGVRAHRALDRHRHAQPRGGAAAGAEEPDDPGAGDLSLVEPAGPPAAVPDRRARGPRRRAARRPRGARRRGQPGRAALSELEVELAPIDERLKYIGEEKATIEATLAELEGSIGSMPGNEMVIGGMERDIASLQAQYDAALKNRGQAELGERMEVMSKGERFSLIEQPSLPGQPAKPRRVLLAAAGLVGGIASGIGLIVLMEMLNRSIRRPVDITTGLGIQPFATVPYIQTGSETRWKRGAVVAALVVALGVIPLVLLLGAHLLHAARPLVRHLGRGARARARARAGVLRPAKEELAWNASRPPSRRPRSAAATRPGWRRSAPGGSGPAAPRRSGPPGPSSPPSSRTRG